MKNPTLPAEGGGSGDLLITCANVMMGKKKEKKKRYIKKCYFCGVVLFTRHDRYFSRRLKNTVAASFLSWRHSNGGWWWWWMDGRTGRERENDDGNITDTQGRAFINCETAAISIASEKRENERNKTKKTTARLLSAEPIIAVCRRQLQSNFTHLFTRRHTQQTRMIGPFNFPAKK